MSTVEQEALERVHSDAKAIGKLLEQKGASGPCLRCKNDQFYAIESSESTYLIVCSHCGLKFEHVHSILSDPNTVNSSTKLEEEEDAK